MIVAFGVSVTWHGALVRVYNVLGWNKWGLSAFNYIVITILLLLWLIFVIAAESILRRGADQGTLLKRSAWTIGILVALLVLGQAIGRLV